MRNKLVVLIAIIFLFACKDQNTTKDLTSLDSLNLKMVKQENVAILGAPPMIPEDHPVVIGDDVNHFQNGGEACLECHNNKEEVDVPQTMHPERNNCLQCHIPYNNESQNSEDFHSKSNFKKETDF